MDGIGAEFFKVTTFILLQINYFLGAVLYAKWLRPFVWKKTSAIFPAALYWLMCLLNGFIDTRGILSAVLYFLKMAVPFILAYLTDRRNPRQKIFLSVLFPAVQWLSWEIFTEIGNFERDFVFRFKLFQNSIFAIIAEFIIWSFCFYGGTLLLLWLAANGLQSVYHNKHEELNRKEMIMLLMPVVTSLMSIPLIREYYRLWMEGIANGSIRANVPGNGFRLVFCIFSYLAILVLMSFYQQIKAGEDNRHQSIVLQKQIEETERRIEKIEEMNLQIRGIRHDIGNHIAVIESLVKKGNEDALSEYIREWKGQYKAAGLEIKTGNPVTDAVLSEYKSLFEEANVQFNADFSFPQKLHVNAFDLSVILSNALRNALEASDGISEPRVSVTSADRGNVFILNIINKMKKKVPVDIESGLPYTTKESEGHGYGLYNIRSIARKYKGEIEVRQEDREDGLMFVLNIMFVA